MIVYRISFSTYWIFLNVKTFTAASSYVKSMLKWIRKRFHILFKQFLSEFQRQIKFFIYLHSFINLILILLPTCLTQSVTLKFYFVYSEYQMYTKILKKCLIQWVRTLRSPNATKKCCLLFFPMIGV